MIKATTPTPSSTAVFASYGEEPWTAGLHHPALETRRERWVVLGNGLGGTVLLVVACFVARPFLGSDKGPTAS